jgi:hypothetical protein
MQWGGLSWGGVDSLAALQALTCIDLSDSVTAPGGPGGRRSGVACLMCSACQSRALPPNTPPSPLTLQTRRCWPPLPCWQRCTGRVSTGGARRCRTFKPGAQSCAACAPT